MLFNFSKVFYFGNTFTYAMNFRIANTFCVLSLRRLLKLTSLKMNNIVNISFQDKVMFSFIFLLHICFNL